VFKPATDSASLLVPTQIFFFTFGYGVLLEGRHKWKCFSVFMAYFGPGRQSNGPILGLKFFLETRLSSESLEPLIDFLAYLGPKLCHKKQSGQNFHPYKH